MTLILIILFATFLILTGLAYFGQLQLAVYFGLVVIVCSIILLFLWLNEMVNVFVKGNAPYVRTSRKLINKMLNDIEFKDGSSVYELGCGDGRFIRALAKKNKNLKITGFEYFIVPYLMGRTMNIFSKAKVKIKLQDFFKVDLSGVDYIFCYLINTEQEKLKEKLNKELKPGAIVISNTFKFKDWQPIKTIEINKAKKSGLSNFVYIYQK
ncbi:class I SAM-dependent methyltransferase [Patescibacteria group bacterium]